MWGKSGGWPSPYMQRGAAVSEASLQAYVDDMLLPPRRRLEIEEHLSRHPDEARRISDFQTQNRRLHEQFDHVLSADLPPEIQTLEHRLQRKLSRRNSYRRIRRFAVSASLAAAVLGAGYVGVRTLPIMPVEESLTAAIETATKPFMRDTLSSESQPAVTKAIATASGSASALDGSTPDGPDLHDFGFELIGSRLVGNGADGDTAQFIYESGEGRRIMLYLSPPTAGKRQVSLTREGAISILSWSNEGGAYSMVGEIKRDLMLAIGQAVDTELSALATQSSKMPTSAKDGSATQSLSSPDGAGIRPAAAPQRTEAASQIQ